jgi:predicted regulator of Ras-like GTPase activity (Roadblock/LC7/MglB family)
MEAAQALADLTEISSQIEVAVIFDETGQVAGSTLTDAARADELARRATELLRHAESLRGAEVAPTQLEIATTEGSVFVVRDGKRRIAATTPRQPTAGLVFYDLKSALRQIEETPPPRKAKKRPRAAKQPAPPEKPDAA